MLSKLDLTNWGPVTVLLIVITAVAAIAGAVICIVHPATLTFEALLNDLEKFAVGLGLLGIGRGVATGSKHLAAAQTIAANPGLDAPSSDLYVPDQQIQADQGDAGAIR